MKAFPQHYNQAVRDKVGGMDLRDYFAAHALQALITKMPLGELNRDEYTGVYEDVAFSAYEYANEMIKEREKTNG